MENEKMSKSVSKLSFFKLIFVLIISLIAVYLVAYYYGIVPERTYKSEYFGIETVKSSVDFNHNDIDDYTDILFGARLDAENHPLYDSRYWETGYPPDDIGVCTDVIWRAFKNAGYSLRDMVDADIESRPEAYPNIEVKDYNIDFRRVINLHVFFKEYAVPLTNDIDAIDQWQAGDIVIFGDDEHIGIISDKRNKKGHAYVIHNGGQEKREEDLFARATLEVTGHYRFDASLIQNTNLIHFEDNTNVK